jgi:hypothetical protein
MANSFPAVLNIFYGRLKSEFAEERAHAASAILDVAGKEPGLLDAQLLKKEVARMKNLGDRGTVNQLLRALRKVEGTPVRPRYKYGL